MFVGRGSLVSSTTLPAVASSQRETMFRTLKCLHRLTTHHCRHLPKQSTSTSLVDRQPVDHQFSDSYHPDSSRLLYQASPARSTRRTAFTTARTPTQLQPVSQTRKMSSDADYASFLDKANQDTGSASAQGTSKQSYGTKSVNTNVPKVLEQVEEYYVSDADEPFEPVALEYSGSKVTAGM